MININLQALFGKLNAPTRQALEEAATLGLNQTHYHVEIEHWLACLITIPNGDIQAIFSAFGIDQDTVTRELNETIQGSARGHTRAPALSQRLVEITKDAWLLASIEYDQALISSGHLLTSMALNGTLRQISPQLNKIQPEDLRQLTRAIVSLRDEAKPTN